MDTTIFRWINNLAGHTTWANSAMEMYAKFGVVLFAGLLVASFLAARRAGDLGGVAGTVWAGCSALVALLVAQSLGRQVNRPRPYTMLEHVHLLVAKSADFSFPSDHATTVGAVACGLLLVNRRFGTVAVVGALMMAFARVYVGAHYPSDVLVGLTIGAAVAGVGARFVTPLIASLLRRIATTPLRALISSTPVVPGQTATI